MAAARALRKDVIIQLGMIMVPVHVLSVIREDKEASLTTLCVGAAGGSHAPAPATNLLAALSAAAGTAPAPAPVATAAPAGHAPNKIEAIYRCPTCQNEDKTAMVKGKAVGSGFVVLSQEDIDAAAPDESLTKKLAFTAHPRTDVLNSTRAAGKLYYLEPGSAAAREPYAVISRMVEEFDDLAFCTMFAVRSVAAPYMLGQHNGVLTINQLAYPESVNTPPEVQDPQTIAPEYLDVMRPFVDTITAPFSPDSFANVRRETLAAFIAAQEATASGQPAPVRKAIPAAPSMLDMLKASVEAANPPAPAAKPKRASKPKVDA